VIDRLDSDIGRADLGIHGKAHSVSDYRSRESMQRGMDETIGVAKTDCSSNLEQWQITSDGHYQVNSWWLDEFEKQEREKLRFAEWPKKCQYARLFCTAIGQAYSSRI